jgi:hypothetical protein
VLSASSEWRFGRLAGREFNVFVLLADGELPGRQRRSQRR